MGIYAPLRVEQYGWGHTLAVACKVPALFGLTLVVTAPSLYVFSALARSPLDFRATVRVLLAATVVTCAVLGSLAPVTAFFTFSTKSHPFLQVLNALLFTLAGLAGLATLRGSVREVFAAGEVPAAERRLAQRVFLAWVVVYGLVAAQMAWILRPFVGAPGRDAALFRATESNVFEGLLEALRWI